jgi:DNA-directed DNA polymerase III PolC
MPFVHLDAHSSFSLLEGVVSVEELVSAAEEAGMGALALADTNGMYGVVPFARACAERGVRPIFGAEIVSGFRRAVVLARDRRGYGELCRLVTRRHLEAGFDFESALAGVSDHLFVLTADEGLLRRLRGRRGVYVGLPVGSGAAWRRLRGRLVALARELGLGVVALNGARFLRPEDHRVHRVLSAIREGCTVGSLPAGAAVSPECWFRGHGQMVRLFGDVPEAVRATWEIAEQCEVDLELGRPKPPRFPLPSGESPFSYLCKLAFRGLSERYRPITKEAYDTLSRELDVIARMDLAEYFLVCWDIVRHARERGMPCLGRGSAANSIVSYCLYITHVDPLRHRMFFERFLNLERESFPDFDIDFGTEDREEVLSYVFERYGESRVAMIGTHVVLRARGVLRDVAAALGIPRGEIDGFVKRLPHFTDLRELEEEMGRNPEIDDLPVGEEPFRTLLGIARRIAGFPRHLGTHPCGIVIAPEPITEYMPLQRGDKGLVITQWSMYPVEDAGLIKIDLLGQKGLAVISETIRAVSRNEGRAIDPAAIDYLGDPLGRRWLREGRTEGCFYIESPIMIQLLQQARCEDFEVLTALSSIIRPGVSNYGGKRQYLRRHLGLEPVSYLHPLLEPILGDTYGCLIYQEQVIQIAAAVAGMTLGEADGLRRCMSKKRNWHRMETYRERFLSGARERGIPAGVARELFRQIESFAGYAFCKAHSASFAMESFASVYWKSHYPAEFMAAVLNNEGGYYSPLEYMEEARRLGLTLLPPDVNESGVGFSGAGGRLRVGLKQIKGLTRRAQEAVVAAREADGPFRSLPEFFRRVPLSRREALALARCGALDGFGRTRPEVLWVVEILFGGSKGNGSEPRRIGDVDPRLLDKVPSLAEYPLPLRLRLELETLGLCVSAHPLEMFPEKLARVRRVRPVVPLGALPERVGRTVYCLGWRVTGKRTMTSGKQEMMAFLTFSDPTGRVDATLFPAVFRRYAKEVRRGPGPFLIKGRVEEDLGSLNLVASDLKLL